MEHIEMVESLRTKANVSISEAKDALERANWDMLEAMILLENDGKTEKNSAESSSAGTQTGETYEVVAATASSTSKGRAIRSLWGDICKFFRFLASFLCKNFFIVKRKGRNIAFFPLLVLLLFFFAGPKMTLAVLFIGIFFGCGYSIEGKDFDSDSAVNRVMSEVRKQCDDAMDDKNE